MGAPDIRGVRTRAAQVARRDDRVPPQNAQRPAHIFRREAAVFPQLVTASSPRRPSMSTVTYSRRPASPAANCSNFSAPVSLRDRPGLRLVGSGTAIRPRMHRQPPGAHVAVVAPDAVPAPALEIPAAPDGDVLDLRQVERAVHPTAATPPGRANVPVGMVVEAHQGHRGLDAAQPQRAQVMEVARAVNQEPGGPQAGDDGGTECLHLGVRRAETQARPPTRGKTRWAEAAARSSRLRRGRCADSGFPARWALCDGRRAIANGKAPRCRDGPAGWILRCHSVPGPVDCYRRWGAGGDGTPW